MTVLLRMSALRQIVLLVGAASLIGQLITGALLITLSRPPLPPEIDQLATRISAAARVYDMLRDQPEPLRTEVEAAIGVRVTPMTEPFAPLHLLPADLDEQLTHDLGPGWRVTGTDGPSRQMLVRTPNSAWFSIEEIGAHIRPGHPGPLMPLLAITFAMGFPLAFACLWAARGVTGPLTSLAQAAERAGAANEPLPVPERGTLEIRRLARAFNGLLDRLHTHLRERTRMLAAVSHDLRTPLTRLRLRTEAMDETPLRAKLLRDLEAMEFMTQSTLVFLDEEQRHEPMDNVDLAALLQTVCDEFTDSGDDVAYEGPSRAALRCQPRALERALTNLIDNAIKFGNHATVALRLSNRQAIIEVADSGPGIPDAEKSRVFHPFYRTDQARGGEVPGVGLGLAIAQTVARAHGGSLELVDREPHGLLARLVLPQIDMN